MELIDSYGYDKVEKQLNIYLELNDQENSFNKNLKAITHQYDENLSRYQKVSEQLNQLVDSLDEKKIQEIDTNAEKMDFFRNQLKDLENKLAKIKKQIEQYKRTLLERREKSKQIEKIVLPENIEQIDMDSRNLLDVELLAGFELKQDLCKIIQKYRNQIKKIDIFREKVYKANQSKETVQDICEKAKQYLQSHKEEKDCPLCHTTFKNWEALVSAIDNFDFDNTEKLNEDFYIAQCELKKNIR